MKEREKAKACMCGSSAPAKQSKPKQTSRDGLSASVTFVNSIFYSISYFEVSVFFICVGFNYSLVG